ncbi:MAG TPA: type IV toxin-antitoxin system AbiEi family antitoxin domain-containing protein [Solirubrobacteraceae bacterium]|nr:type IV toxin-antitoxin system AbiEi family antitoxin domain-containing protein [Solirubrobacteraceae bacterium]
MPAQSSIDGLIRERANRYGHIHYRQLRVLGLSRSAIAARCTAGRLTREHRGVYSVGHSQRTPIARADAAVMACGERAALSHDSAAALHGLRRWPPLPEISSALTRDRPGIRCHRTTTLTRADITYRDGIRVTTVARTLADIAPRLTDIQLERAIHEARRNRDLPDKQLVRLYELCPRAAKVFDAGEAPSRSVFQHYLKTFLCGRGLPIPEFEAVWHGYEVDGLYADQKLIIELDGYRDHSERDRFESDRRRDALALELGFVTLRITWRRLTREPDELERQLRAILVARTPAHAQPATPAS